MELWPSTRIAYITLMVRPTYNGKPNPLSDEKVRQALNYATNKPAVIAVTTLGLGTADDLVRAQSSRRSTSAPTRFIRTILPRRRR